MSLKKPLNQQDLNNKYTQLCARLGDALLRKEAATRDETAVRVELDFLQEELNESYKSQELPVS